MSIYWVTVIYLYYFSKLKVFNCLNFDQFYRPITAKSVPKVFLEFGWPFSPNVMRDSTKWQRRDIAGEMTVIVVAIREWRCNGTLNWFARAARQAGGCYVSVLRFFVPTSETELFPVEWNQLVCGQSMRSPISKEVSGDLISTLCAMSISYVNRFILPLPSS